MAIDTYTDDFYDFSKHFRVYVMRFADSQEFYIRKNN